MRTLRRWGANSAAQSQAAGEGAGGAVVGKTQSEYTG